jgi:hypothetical protein
VVLLFCQTPSIPNLPPALTHELRKVKKGEASILRVHRVAQSKAVKRTELIAPDGKETLLPIFF